MRLIHIAYICSAILTAASALVAAGYWYLSSRPQPSSSDSSTASVSDAPELHILGAQVDIYSIQAALAESSRLNKCAAVWSALAALLGAVTSILGIA
jgi:hypothetical protein